MCYQHRTLKIVVLNSLSKVNIDILDKNIDVLKTPMIFSHHPRWVVLKIAYLPEISNWKKKLFSLITDTVFLARGRAKSAGNSSVHECKLFIRRALTRKLMRIYRFAIELNDTVLRIINYRLRLYRYFVFVLPPFRYTISVDARVARQDRRAS